MTDLIFTQANRTVQISQPPETVVSDYQRLMEMAEFQRSLEPSRTTILKDNISWHFPFPGANTTPWRPGTTSSATRTKCLPSLPKWDIHVPGQNDVPLIWEISGEAYDERSPGGKPVWCVRISW
ncbi:MAG: hypothetical protein ABSA52_09325 [Candidatus Binatia bacterium]|jgi:hypothetical protein